MKKPLCLSTLLAVVTTLGLGTGCLGGACQSSESSETTAQSVAPSPEQGSMATTEENRNTPPTLENLTFHPSKFVRCGQTIKICAHAQDRQGDRMRFEWAQLEGPSPKSPLEIASTERDGRTAQQCVQFTPAPGDAKIRVGVFDSGPDSTRADKGGIGFHDSMTFPVYANDKCS